MTEPLDPEYQPDTWVDIPQIDSTATLRQVIDQVNTLTAHVNYQARRMIGMEYE